MEADNQVDRLFNRTLKATGKDDSSIFNIKYFVESEKNQPASDKKGIEPEKQKK